MSTPPWGVDIRELDASTHDGRRHIAIGAFVHTGRWWQPIGIVRMVGIGIGRAELAVEVVDAWHGRGVGTALLRAARERATTLGYSELVAEVHSGSPAAA